MSYFNLRLLTCAIGLSALGTGIAQAATPSVEIIAMAHPPVISALKPVRAWLAAQGGKVRVSEVNAESPVGENRLAAAGFTGHIPILILIDGRHEYTRKDGVKIALVKFPATKDSPPGMRGNWLPADFENIVRGKIEQP